MASSLDEPVDAQLQVDSNDEALNQAAKGSQAPAASGFVNYSRQMDFAPQNVRAKNWLKDHDDTFRKLDDLREQVSYQATTGKHITHQIVSRAGILQRRMNISRRSVRQLIGRLRTPGAHTTTNS